MLGIFSVLAHGALSALRAGGSGRTGCAVRAALAGDGDGLAIFTVRTGGSWRALRAGGSRNAL